MPFPRLVGPARTWTLGVVCAALTGCAAPPAIGPAGQVRAPARPATPATATALAAGVRPQEVLAAAARYVARFEDTFSLVLSDEQFVQDVAYFPALLHDARPRHREMRSEMLFMRLEEEQRWMAVRSVQQVDGRIIPDSHARIEVLLHDEGPRAARTRGLLDESARFNLGSIDRNISDATAVLRYLDPAMQPRFDFAVAGSETVHDRRAWKLGFTERQRPTIIQHNGLDFPSSGWVFVAQDDGAVLGTVLTLSARDVHVRIAADYTLNDELELWVPSRMEEQYLDPRSPGEAIHCVATYANFRRFGTTARLLAPGPAPAGPSAGPAPAEAAAAPVVNATAAPVATGPDPLELRLIAPPVGALVAASHLSDAAAVTIASPSAIVEFDTRRLRGDPAVLAWSPDGRQLYLQTVQRDVNGRAYAERHYIIDVGTRQLAGLDVEPGWAAAYWKWKSAKASPVQPDFSIDVDSKNDIVKAMNFDGGAMATGSLDAGGGRGGGGNGMSASEFANAANASQTVVTSVLSVRGVRIGKWENENVVPGLTFGWAPSPNALLAFAENSGGPLMLVDARGGVQKIAGTRSVMLPAWTADAARLAWLERKKHGHYTLLVGAVGTR